VEDFVAAAVFATALAALFVMAGATLKPFLPSKIVEVPATPGKDAPTIKVYVYNDTGRLYAVEYAGSDVETFRSAVGIPGSLVAVFTVYPGGYNCTRYTHAPVRIGPDPYTGLWCPPPFDAKVEMSTETASQWGSPPEAGGSSSSTAVRGRHDRL
jgi:hypothetical protein